ncbi:MAG: phosphoribosylformylglycinamidine cyclo-ligase [Caldisericia bacterium]|jgi:phosphoribosylformylglycinamidine cyclo-ligase|nr:phosphoribosylformylglycinamidine cyclo-ligase [Caldisericia bacterium]HOW03133.1 phosphoribosylformylglycinamidine cyclo-ligase [Caldisericia bacterium]
MIEDFYSKAGVSSEEEENALGSLIKWVNATFSFRDKIGKALLPIGFFANVIDTSLGIGIAISTDGVGTKTLIAELLNKYDTIGIDCIAMNVNDILCVGAEPVSFVDYIAVNKVENAKIEEISKGLYEGAKLANINIPGGEIAQVKEILHDGENSFDIIGTAIGFVKPDKIITGDNIENGDIIIGLKSSGIHSNGFTLARKVLLSEKNYDYNMLLELLTPTKIYVKEVLALINSISVKGLANITGEGFLNILRLTKNAKYVIDELPEPMPVFKKIQEKGNIPTREMYKDFNMGLGFCVVVGENNYPKAERILKDIGADFLKIGYVEEAEEKSIEIKPLKLKSTGKEFIEI